MRSAQQRHGAATGRVQNGGGPAASRARVLLRQSERPGPRTDAVVLRQLYQVGHVDAGVESIVGHVRLVQRE